MSLSLSEFFLGRRLRTVTKIISLLKIKTRTWKWLTIALQYSIEYIKIIFGIQHVNLFNQIDKWNFRTNDVAIVFV